MTYIPATNEKPQVVKTAAYVVTTGDDKVPFFADTTSASFAFTLPSIATVDTNFSFFVSDPKAIWGTNKFTLTPNGTDKIENVAASYDLNTAGSSVQIFADKTNSNWKIV